jgi:hypothetical protein
MYRKRKKGSRKFNERSNCATSRRPIMKFGDIVLTLVCLILLALLAEATLHAIDRDAEIQAKRVAEFRSHWEDR